MNSKTFNKIVADTILSTAELLTKKGGEYASDEDRLSNFKAGAKELGLTPLQIALVYSHKHFSAICNYVRKDAKGLTQNLSEPIEGRIDDLINYCFFLKALITDTKSIHKEEPLPIINDWTKQPPFTKQEPSNTFPGLEEAYNQKSIKNFEEAYTNRLVADSLKKEPYND